MTIIASTIEFETIEATHVLPLPNEYEYTYTLPSVVAFNAQGASFVQKLSDTPIREWTLTWAIMTQAQMESMRDIWDCLSSQVVRFNDIWDVDYSVVRHPDQTTLDADELKAAGTMHWRVVVRLRESSDPYEA